MIKLPVPYYATWEESNLQFARAFTYRANIFAADGKENDATRLKQMVENAVGSKKAKEVAQDLASEHEL